MSQGNGMKNLMMEDEKQIPASVVHRQEQDNENDTVPVDNGAFL